MLFKTGFQTLLNARFSTLNEKVQMTVLVDEVFNFHCVTQFLKVVNGIGLN